ncbi:hypothetical protein VTI74DRAFT_9775 [Chaetomium olivicolor]
MAGRHRHLPASHPTNIKMPYAERLPNNAALAINGCLRSNCELLLVLKTLQTSRTLTYSIDSQLQTGEC